MVFESAACPLAAERQTLDRLVTQTMPNRPTTWNGVEIPYGASITQLTSLVRGSTPERWAAFVALAHTPSESALAALADSARSSVPHVRRAVVEAIGVHPEGGRLGALVCSLLSDSHDFVVRSACEAATRHRVTEAHDAIVRLLDATPEASCIAALQALRELSREGDFERVLQVFSSATSEAVRKEAAWTLHSSASASTWRRLFALWGEDKLPRHREWACQLAATYGTREVLTHLARLTHDIDGHVRDVAARAVREIEARGLGRCSDDGG